MLFLFLDIQIIILILQSSFSYILTLFGHIDTDTLAINRFLTCQFFLFTVFPHSCVTALFFKFLTRLKLYISFISGSFVNDFQNWTLSLTFSLCSTLSISCRVTFWPCSKKTCLIYFWHFCIYPQNFGIKCKTNLKNRFLPVLFLCPAWPQSSSFAVSPFLRILICDHVFYSPDSEIIRFRSVCSWYIFIYLWYNLSCWSLKCSYTVSCSNTITHLKLLEKGSGCCFKNHVPFVECSIMNTSGGAVTGMKQMSAATLLVAFNIECEAVTHCGHWHVWLREAQYPAACFLSSNQTACVGFKTGLAWSWFRQASCGAAISGS